MKLAKALKLKNRIVGDIQRLSAILTRENSRTVKQTEISEIDLKEIVRVLDIRKEELIAIKTKIAKANSDIWNKIFRIAELKQTIVLLSSLNTKNGTIKEGFGDSVYDETYVAFLSQKDIDDKTTEIQRLIEQLQDEIDTYNATIEVDLNL